MQLSWGITNGTLTQWGVVVGASLVGAVLDLRTRRIPNVLCGPLLLAGLVWSTWYNGVEGLAEAAAASIALALPFVLLFLLAGGGAGDAKLMAGIGAWLGLKQGIIVLGCVCLAGGALAIATAIVKRSLKIVLANIRVLFYNLIVSVLTRRGTSDEADKSLPEESERLTVPYGVAIFAGVLFGAMVIWLWK